MGHRWLNELCLLLLSLICLKLTRLKLRRPVQGVTLSQLRTRIDGLTIFKGKNHL
jgi:hypothetical protein